MSSGEIPNYDTCLEAAHARAERAREGTWELVECDACGELGVLVDDRGGGPDQNDCRRCGASRCPACGVMTRATIARVQGREQCSDCAAVVALERFAGWLLLTSASVGVGQALVRLLSAGPLAGAYGATAPDARAALDALDRAQSEAA